MNTNNFIEVALMGVSEFIVSVLENSQYIRLCTCVSVRIYVCMYVCVYVCIYTCIYVCTCVCIKDKPKAVI